MHPCEGLTAASAWFTCEHAIDHTLNFAQPAIWVFCIDKGSLTLTQQGKPAKKLFPCTQLFVSNGKPVRFTIPANEHVCFTSVMITEQCIQTFLKSNGISYPIDLQHAKAWKPPHVDTPAVMLVMEQIRWGVRGNRLPPPAYLCKAIELLCLFAHNLEQAQHKRERRHYVTWDNEQKLYRIKDCIDANPLNPPTTEVLCRMAEMSESKLRICFKSLYKKTLHAYMREAVMKRAMQMLADDEKNIKNIATRCGYENPSKFTAAFKEVHGITPSDFRKGFGL